MGEAGGVVVLEELEHAKARGAKIYAELLGYGVSSDANHITEPDPTGTNPARAMTMAFARRGHRPDRDRLHQRARHLDAARRRERDARDQARASARRTRVRTPVSSTKGATGHCLGAAGAVEAIFTILATRARHAAADDQLRGRPIPTCDLDYIPNEARDVGRSRSASRTRSASAGTTPASSSASTTGSAAAKVLNTSSVDPRNGSAALRGRRRLSRHGLERSSSRTTSRQAPSAADPLADADLADAERCGAARSARVVVAGRLPACSVHEAAVRGRSRSAALEQRAADAAVRGLARRRRRSPRRRLGRRRGASTARPRPSRRPRRRARRRSGARRDVPRPTRPTTAPPSRTVARPVAIPSREAPPRRSRRQSLVVERCGRARGQQ